MPNLLLLVHTQAQVDLLAETARTAKHQGYTGCWAIVSPAISVNAKEATEKFDLEIAQLEKAKKDAAMRDDFEAAAGYKQQLEGKILDRSKAVLDAWKAVPDEDRAQIYRQKFAPFLSEWALPFKLSPTQDHYDTANWVQMLNSMIPVWFDRFPHGSYTIAWPGAIPAVLMPIAAPETPAVAPKVEKEPETAKRAEKPKKPAPVFANREEELKGMRFFGLTAAAKKSGVDPKGKKGPQIIAEILAKEAQLATV